MPLIVTRGFGNDQRIVTRGYAALFVGISEAVTCIFTRETIARIFRRVSLEQIFRRGCQRVDK